MSLREEARVPKREKRGRKRKRYKGEKRIGEQIESNDAGTRKQKNGRKPDVEKQR